ncbi:shufflon system plasmid conjugative transfer pilus tip adhesin PilV [Rugamonas sp. CCM 8940]|uniref:shufflon system plasmid conjugative transfer pilus tip adhesin PilV n=1 Tax=Rugamonas sp. CCM 8940 TaxID=2765359 RepID=UPI0018F72A62|nr:shufflon system plasmid conjugative transfer pilus tip adhesin PilV [Rugamonas sp. CCM 8940]MBJ7311948.1 shufflon system plasmid conjugative transfer pilus tip adhesin PilV [Rugamonas sp. CCM 8940]
MKISRQGGMTLIEMIGALAIGSIMMAGLSAMIGDALDDGEGQQAALYQAQVVAAARQYIGANYQALLAATPAAASVAVVDIAALKAQRFLPAGFAPQNGYQQVSCVLVRQPTPGSGKLDALIVGSGGQKIEDKNIAAVAAGAGQGSGYITAATPGTAVGASWSMVTTAYRGAKCPGAAAALTGGADDAGHLVSNLFFDGPGQLSTDFLYRSAVPGRPELNQMRAPIHMLPGSGAQATENDAGDPRCTVAAGTGKIAVDTQGRVLSCQSGVWKRQGAAFWKDPVASFAALPGSDNQPGDVRMVLDLSRGFTWNGSQWKALAVDQDGNLALPGRLGSHDAILNRVVVAKSACDADDPDGTMARDASGLVMSCQFGLWQSQTNMALQASDTGCAVIMPSSVRVPDPECTTAYHGPRNYSQAVDTWEAEIKRQMMPTKNGLINVNVWARMNRDLANNDKVQGQVRLQVDIIDNDTGSSIGHTDAESVRIDNSSATINATLSKTVQRNRTGYSVRIRPSWSTLEGPTTPFNRANFRNYDGSVVEQVPLSTGWNMDLFQ